MANHKRSGKGKRARHLACAICGPHYNYLCSIGHKYALPPRDRRRAQAVDD